MDKHRNENGGAAGHALAGAGLGAAGAAQSVAIVGLSILPVLPVFIVLGAIGGLAWWGIRRAAEK
jgi:hypothetical protein